jgi:predicted nucleic acid-binding protein
VITLDTSAIFALLDRRERHHGQVREALTADPGPYLVPAGILAEIAYLVENTLGGNAFDAFLSDLEEGTYRLQCGDEDLPRIRELTRRYGDMPLGFADAAVVACAERNGGRVLTLDLRHFGTVAREGKLTILPD